MDLRSNISRSLKVKTVRQSNLVIVELFVLHGVVVFPPRWLPSTMTAIVKDYFQIPRLAACIQQTWTLSPPRAPRFFGIVNL